MCSPGKGECEECVRPYVKPLLFAPGGQLDNGWIPEWIYSSWRSGYSANPEMSRKHWNSNQFLAVQQCRVVVYCTNIKIQHVPKTSWRSISCIWALESKLRMVSDSSGEYFVCRPVWSAKDHQQQKDSPFCNGRTQIGWPENRLVYYICPLNLINARPGGDQAVASLGSYLWRLRGILQDVMAYSSTLIRDRGVPDNPHATHGRIWYKNWSISIHEAWSWDQALQNDRCQKMEERKGTVIHNTRLKINTWHERRKRKPRPTLLAWTTNGAY